MQKVGTCIAIIYVKISLFRLEDGTTPLQVAAMWGFTECVEMLLANGGDPFMKDQVCIPWPRFSKSCT